MKKFKDFIKEEKEEDPYYKLIGNIRDLISDNIELQRDGDVDSRTLDLAAKEIVKMLKDGNYLTEPPTNKD